MSRKMNPILCEQARAMTNTKTSNDEIEYEINLLSEKDRSSAIKAVDEFRLRSAPFDVDFKSEDFVRIAYSFHICSSTLYYIYFDLVADFDDFLNNAIGRSSNNGTPVDHGPLMITKDEYGE